MPPTHGRLGNVLGAGFRNCGFKTPVAVYRQAPRYRLTGITRDGITNAPVAGVTVKIYESLESDFVNYPTQEPKGKLRAVLVSDASGVYSVDVTGTEASGLLFKAVAYKAGAPNVSGSSVPTLQGTPA